MKRVRDNTRTDSPTEAYAAYQGGAHRPVNAKSRAIMEQDFNHWNSDQTWNTISTKHAVPQRETRNPSEPSPASRPFHDRPVEFVSPSGSYARESVLIRFRELLERVFNQGI
jgi:hypothetical protein